MIVLYTSRKFTDDTIINDIDKYFTDEVIKAVDTGTFKIGELEKKIFTDINCVYTEDKSTWEKYGALLKYILALRYNEVTKDRVIFDLKELKDCDVTELLAYVDKYNGSVLSVKVSKPLMYNGYEFLVNRDRVVSGGNQLFHYILTYELGGGKHKPVRDIKELIVRYSHNVYCFDFNSTDNLILFDTDIELDMFIRDIYLASRHNGLSCNRTVAITKETYTAYKEAISNISDTSNIVRIIDCNSLDNESIESLIDDDFDGLTIYAAVYCRFNKGEYCDNLSNPTRVTSYDGLYRISFLK